MHPSESLLHDYADHALSGSERDEIDRHLSSCVECRRLVDDLGELRRQIGALPPLTPPPAAWGRIERELVKDVRSARGRWVPWMAVAAVLLVAAVVSVRLLRTTPTEGPTPAAAAPGTGTRDLAQSVQTELEQAVDHYQKAIAGLEQIKNSEKGALDPQTAAAFEKSLTTIDQAISESRAALKAQPNNEPARQSLLDTFMTKISLLEDTVALINEMRKGNDAGAARIVSGLKKKS